MSKTSRAKSPSQIKHPKPEPTPEDLQEQLRILKLLPGDFRDIEPSSPEWEQYATYMPETAEAMDKWIHGPVLCIGKPITPWEKTHLLKTHTNILVCSLDPNASNLDALHSALQNAEAEGVSLVYMKGFPLSITRAINWLASFFKMRIRAKHEYMEETA